jgi:hypothetical protein
MAGARWSGLSDKPDEVAALARSALEGDVASHRKETHVVGDPG